MQHHWMLKIHCGGHHNSRSLCCHFRCQYHSLVSSVRRRFFAPLLCTIYLTTAVLSIIIEIETFSMRTIQIAGILIVEHLVVTYVWVDLIAAVWVSLPFQIIVSMNVTAIFNCKITLRKCNGVKYVEIYCESSFSTWLLHINIWHAVGRFCLHQWQPAPAVCTIRIRAKQNEHTIYQYVVSM